MDMDSQNVLELKAIDILKLGVIVVSLKNKGSTDSINPKMVKGCVSCYCRK